MACTASPIPRRATGREERIELLRRHSQDARVARSAGARLEQRGGARAERSIRVLLGPAEPHRPPIFEGCTRPQGALGGRRHRIGRDAERQAQTSVDEVPEIAERRIRVSERGIGADPIAVGVVPRLAGAGHAEGGELAERRVEGVVQRSALEARHERRDQVHRGLAQDPGRLAAGPSLEAAAGRIRGLGAQAGKASGDR